MTYEEELPYPEENRHDIMDIIIENENNDSLINQIKKKLKGGENERQN